MSVEHELSLIAKKHDGLLRAEDVVAFARNKKTALHSQFTWNNTRAAEEYRLWQARQIIRVTLTTLPETNNEIRAYVSMTADRYTPGGGYRGMVEVMTAKQTRGELLAQALAELKMWQERYRHLRALVPIFEAREAVERRAVKVNKST